MKSRSFSNNRMLLMGLIPFLFVFGFLSGSPQQASYFLPSNQSGDIPRFEEKKCSEVFRGTFSWFGISQSRFRCGYLITWRDYDLQEEGGTIRLAVMETYPARKPKTTPVLWLAGGPGSTGFPYNPSTAMQFADDFGRSWIQFSQRGSHLSETYLLCREYRQVYLDNWETDLGIETWNTKKQKALEDCRTRLKDDLSIQDSSAFNSEFNALDVLYLVRGLGYGYGNVNLYGGSYGTLLAQHVLALSPGDIRSVVLEGVVPLGVDWEAEYPRNFRNSLQLIFDSCNTSPECREAYPDLRGVFFQLLEQLKDQPLCMPVKDGNTTYSNVCLDDYGFLNALGDMLYISDNIKKIPRIIYGAWNRDLTQITELGKYYYAYERSDSWPWGMYYSVYCTEFPRFDPNGIDLRQVEPQFQALYQSSREFVNGVCPLYGRSEKSYGDARIADNGVPVLIFNGKFDPVTPMKYGRQVADELSVEDDFFYTSDRSAHNSINSVCAGEIMRDFFNTPEKSPYRDCWKDQSIPIKFELPGDAIGSSWWQELQQTMAEAWNWLELEMQKQIDKAVEYLEQGFQELLEQLWQGFLQLLEQLWQDIQEQFIKWFEEILRDWLNQCLPSAFLPLGALAVVWVTRRRRANRGG